MNRRLLLLIALCSSSVFAQLKPAPGFQPKTPTQTQQQQTTTPAASNTPVAAPAVTLVAAPKPNANGGYDLAVAAQKQWTDTGIDVKAGDKVSFNSDGTIQFGGSLAAAPDGLTRGWRDLMRALPVNSAGNGALIGRIGAADFSTPFLIGKSKEITAPIDGRLFLGINQLATESSNGSYAVKLAIAKAAAAATNTTSGATATPKANVSLGLLKEIPRRVEDQVGNKGDIVNFVILGDKEKLENAFQDAGWVLVDKTTSAAVVNALFSSLDKRAYVQMPMSTLFLFGRSQDYGYAHAEPISVVASRHHLRIWKSDETYEGRPVYVGSCTHDIGFERDQRNNGVTHKIDPNIDLERDYLKETLTSTGLVASSTYLEPTDAVKDAQTATGGTINTDGRVLVLILR
jgi:hypothetical protein